ncbi:hypothetical protein SAMCCGM7_pB0103 (plasmid) [Sinorhizobium americanum CCGM7]|uniref:hypothetical protein n=1 Tax=Sinorhizobium americanum TaxID=194963 RepID=UPI0004D385EF|nr:hypothetical protein [Sinorhizobium americanum]APG86819.1 hypothetical protein SAMCCGM7_pB0103 [Sinorhizobium americanum CCGM7]
MNEEDVRKVEAYVLQVVKERDHRKAVRFAAQSVVKWLGVVGVVTALVSLLVNGTEFFTKKIPQAAAFMAKRVFLGETFRPVLIRRVVEQDLLYSDFCIASHQVIDLDGDKEATDLVVELRTPASQNCKGDPLPGGVTYVVLKEIQWNRVWPEYTLLRTIVREDIGAWGFGTGYPMTFEAYGPFLLGSIYGTRSPGYAVYGYAAGALYFFGKFWALGSLSETEQGEPKSQIGNRLFLPTEEGLMSFEITMGGSFEKKPMSARDIVERNGTALVIEDEIRFTEEVEDAIAENANALTDDPYVPAPQTVEGCDRKVFLNGRPLIFTGRNQDGLCLAQVSIEQTTSVITNVPCAYRGFRQSGQFPWGWVYDAAASEHAILCPEDGDDDEGDSYQYEITVSVN